MPIALILKTVLEITVLGYVLYRLVLLAKETRAFRLLRGLGVILLIWGATVLFDLGVLKVILDGVDMPTVIVVTVLVLFTPEIKEALARLGGRAPFGHSAEERQFLNEIVEACERMAQSKTGALIVLQRADGLADVIGTGVQLNAEVTSAFIEQVFYKDTPLHDGALVIAKRRCAAARCRLPNSSQLDLGDTAHPLGLRHRAGLGLAEVRDAVTVIVSEERGQISYRERGTLERSISPDRLRELLTDAFTASPDSITTPIGERLRAAVTANRGTKFAGFALAAMIWSLNAQTIETEFRINFRPPVPTERLPELVLVTNQTELHVKRARIRGGNFDLLQLLVGQFLDPDHLRDRFEIELKGSASASEAVNDHWNERCPVRDTRGRVELVDAKRKTSLAVRRASPEDDRPLTVVVKLDLLETLALDSPRWQVPIRTVGRLPEGYRAEGTPFLEHHGVVLRFRSGVSNRKQLEAQLKLPQDLVRPLDLTGRKEPFKDMPVRVRLPAEPPEVRELYRRLHGVNYFEATLTYNIKSDTTEADPLARRKAEVVELEQEAVARKSKVEEQSRVLEATREKLLAERGRETVTLQGYATVLADRETARAREKLTERQLAEAKKVRDELAKQKGADQVAIRLEQDAVQAIERDLGYQTNLVKLHGRLISAYTDRIQPVLDLQQETEALLAKGWEPTEGPPPPDSVPALAARLSELERQSAGTGGQLLEAERVKFDAERQRLRGWTSQPDRVQVLPKVVTSLLQLDPIDPEFAKQAPAHQGRVRQLLIELKELRGQFEALWLQEERLEADPFPALARAQLILGKTKARVKRLQAEITLRKLELERRHLMAWIGELESKIVPGRKTMIASVHSFFAGEALRSPEARATLTEALSAPTRAKLASLLAAEKANTAELLRGLASLETELAGIQDQVALRRKRLSREHVFLALRMAKPEKYLLADMSAEELEEFRAPLSGTEEATLKQLTDALSEDSVENRAQLQRRLTLTALRVGKALGRTYLLRDLSAEESQLLDTPPNDAQLRVLTQRLGEIDGEADGDLEIERDKLYAPLYRAVTSGSNEASLPALLQACRKALQEHRTVLGDENSGVQQLLAELEQALVATPPDGSK